MNSFEAAGIKLSVGEHGGEGDLEIVAPGLFVDHRDLLDQAIEPEANSGIGNPIIRGHLLQRSGVQDEPLQEGQILVFEVFQPCLPI